jgi:hypothetical protein
MGMEIWEQLAISCSEIPTLFVPISGIFGPSIPKIFEARTWKTKYLWQVKVRKNTNE